MTKLRSLLLSGLLLVSACGANRSSLKMGETTRADVISQKGEPLSEEKLPIKDSSIMNYKNDEKIQLKGDVVMNRFTNPVADEKLVIWWKHKFKDCSTFSQPLAHDSKSHTPPEIEFSCPEEGLKVIYTEGADIISRVVEYEKK